MKALAPVLLLSPHNIVFLSPGSMDHGHQAQGLRNVSGVLTKIEFPPATCVTVSVCRDTCHRETLLVYCKAFYPRFLPNVNRSIN